MLRKNNKFRLASKTLDFEEKIIVCLLENIKQKCFFEPKNTAYKLL